VLLKGTILTFFISITFLSFGQTKKPEVWSYVSKEGVTFHVKSPFTAIAAKADKSLGDEIQIELNGKSLTVPLDADALEPTYFISLPERLQGAQITTSFSVAIYIIDSEETPAIEARNSRVAQGCDLGFSAIPQSEWRAGLAPPNYSRSFTSVSHAVVHHAAGSNSSTNFTQVVRDIYLYHTQVNGWSDIGYNYLIAQNGDIYNGRDPDGGPQDNVLGAHFCGSNSGTMGICLLGNYETATPTIATWASLQNIIAFKLDKESLDPLGSYPHAFGSIGSIIGHRDGCSTLCPGQNVYNRIASLRTSVNDRLGDCESTLSFSSTTLTINAGEQITFTNSSTGYEQYEWYFEGGNPYSTNMQEGDAITYNYPGVFDVLLIGMTGDLVDSLKFENAVLVKGELSIFPNPVSAGKKLSFAETAPLSKLEILDSQGSLCFSQNLVIENQVIIPYLRAGVYFLRLYSEGVWKTEELIIR
jgi:hypothetical protein